MKRKLLILIIPVILLLIGAVIYCFPNNGENKSHSVAVGQNDQHYPVTVETFDSNGKKTTMTFHHEPKRVIVDRTDNVEMLLALGLEDRIVYASMRTGNISYDNMVAKYGKRLTSLPGVTLAYNDLSMETILSGKPDFILGWKSTFLSKRWGTTDWWKQRGVNTYIVGTSNHVLPEGKIEDECQYLADMGKIFNAEDKTSQMIDEIHKEVKNTKSLMKNQKPKTLVMELSGRQIVNYDRTWLVGNMVEELGGFMGMSSRKLGVEDIIDYDPEVVFLVYLQDTQKPEIKAFVHRPELQNVAAFRNKRVYLAPLDYVYTSGVETITGIRLISEGLNPEIKHDRVYAVNAFDL